MTTDQLLTRISAASRGDRSAFAELVGKYQGLVSATTLSMTGDFQRSEDLAQETFLIAWSKLSELKEPLKFPGWICGIARNCANNWLRRTKTDPLVQSTSLEQAEVSIVDSDPVETVAAKEEAQLVWSSLAEIAPLYREPLIMFYRQGAEIAEIAAALGLTEETVRQRLSRGRKLLKTEVEKTVERTLTATRPDTAFTLAVLAAIPLAATAGCTSVGVSKSIGLFGSGAGAASFGGGLSFLAVLSLIGLFLFSSISTTGLAIVCLYGLWIAIKRSPTPQTKRLMISAALDVNLLVYAMPTLLAWLYYITAIIGVTFYQMYCSINLIPSNLETNLGPAAALINFVKGYVVDVPVFLLLAALVLYVVCRWQKLLYEELWRVGASPARENGKLEILQRDNELRAGEAPALHERLALSTFENEIRIYRGILGWLAGWRDYFRTDAGLRFKRNWTIATVLLAYCGYLIWQAIHFYSMWGLRSSIQNHFIFGLTAWEITLNTTLQIVFFKLISRGITLSETGNADYDNWTAEAVSPERRRRFIKSSLFLLTMAPLLIFVLVVGFNIAYAKRYLWGLYDPYAFNFPIHMLFRSICIATVLSVLVAFWGTCKPYLRNRLYAALFFGIGLWVAATAEWTPLMSNETVRNFLFGWMEKGQLDTIAALDLAKYNFYYFHLFAGISLAIYTTLALWAYTRPQQESELQFGSKGIVSE